MLFPQYISSLEPALHLLLSGMLHVLIFWHFPVTIMPKTADIR